MTKTATPEMIADEAMKRIWTDWLAYHNAQFSGRKYYITAADQMAFYEIAQPVMRSLAASSPPAVEPVAVHPDDEAVDRFAAAMKEKLAKKRAEGRDGWDQDNKAIGVVLSRLLREHVEKGDPLDVGNLAMMIHQRGETIR